MSINLLTQSKISPVEIRLPNGKSVAIPRCSYLFTLWRGTPIRDTYGGKAVLNSEGKPVFAELAILRVLEKAGWDGMWVDTYRRKFRRSMPSESCELPSHALELYERICRANGRRTSGCFDVFAWKDRDYIFVESKRHSKDSIQKTQKAWVEAALASGIQVDSLLICEWDLRQSESNSMQTKEPHEMLTLTHRFTRAVDYAREIHRGTRKGTQVPYMAHLLGVASLVMGETGYVPFAVTEDMVIAALLHDAVEDEGGMPRLHEIEAKFGKEVAKIVEGCSDSFETDPNKKQPWKRRKTSYIKRLREEPEDSRGTLLVSAADKLYNARAILEDYRELKAKVWKRFNRGRKDQLWYYEELIKIYKQRCPNWRIIKELKREVAELARLSGAE